MGQFFSDNVEKALQYIYYENKGYARHGQEGFQLLTVLRLPGTAMPPVFWHGACPARSMSGRASASLRSR